MLNEKFLLMGHESIRYESECPVLRVWNCQRENAPADFGKAETLETLQLENVPRDRFPIALTRSIHVLVLEAGHYWRLATGRNNRGKSSRENIDESFP